MKSTGVSEYLVYMYNGSKEHTRQMDIINVIPARPNISIKNLVQEFKFDKLVGNAESPSYVSNTCSSNQQHSTPPIPWLAEVSHAEFLCAG